MHFDKCFWRLPLQILRMKCPLCTLQTTRGNGDQLVHIWGIIKALTTRTVFERLMNNLKCIWHKFTLYFEQMQTILRCMQSSQKELGNQNRMLFWHVARAGFQLFFTLAYFFVHESTGLSPASTECKGWFLFWPVNKSNDLWEYVAEAAANKHQDGITTMLKFFLWET